MTFLWGAATSSHQIEGNNRNNDWWAWEAEGHIEGGVRSGVATDHWNRFAEDLRLAADLGLNSYRFSVEWSRIEPEEGRYDPTALDWYENLVAECERRGLLPMLTLHHFTSPKWFADRGGFAWSESPQRFAAYARQVVSRVGARVPLWCTINEPMVLTAGGYLGKFMPPAIFDPKAAAAVARNLLLSHVLTYDLIHAEIRERRGPWRDHPLMAGIAHNMLDFMPDRAWHPIERILAAIFDRFYNRAWLDAVTGSKQHFGVLGLLPYAEPVLDALGRSSADFIGVNYYTKAYVKWRPRESDPQNPPDLPVGLSFARRKEEASDLGWAVHPEGLRKILSFVSRRYGRPIYVTENGIADRDDKLRPAFLRAHLDSVARVIEEGADVRGYYHWSLIDNFEWIKGFWPRFGLYSVDYDSFERRETGSARLLKEIITAHEREPSLNRRPSRRVLAGL